MFIKNESSEFDNTLTSTALLHAIVVFVFSEVVARLPKQHCSGEFRKEVGESKLA